MDSARKELVFLYILIHLTHFSPHRTEEKEMWWPVKVGGDRKRQTLITVTVPDGSGP